MHFFSTYERNINIVFDIPPQKSQIRRKSTYLGQPNEGVYELSYEYTSVGFQFMQKNLGPAGPS
jgi:hypothetical protein